MKIQLCLTSQRSPPVSITFLIFLILKTKQSFFPVFSVALFPTLKFNAKEKERREWLWCCRAFILEHKQECQEVESFKLRKVCVKEMLYLPYQTYLILWEDNSQDEHLLAMLLPLRKTCVNIPSSFKYSFFFFPSLLAIKKKASDPM